ncbi:MAG: LrgB family protein [Tissierellia bacterium]|nr:LrgB family protein [Tissierellia bacterium]
MKELLYSPIFGVTITVLFLFFMQKVSAFIKNPILNPFILTLIALIGFLKITNIPLDAYEEGGKILTFFLGPVTVALAVPLYHQRKSLKKHMVPILVGITIGSLAGLLTALGLGKILGLSPEMLASVAPKSTTTAIAVELSQTFKGNPSLTVAFVIVAGVTGNVFGESFLKLLKIKHPTSKGIAIGTASHAMGTNKALEMGAEEGAMSSLAIGLAGIITTLLIPFVLPLFL